MGKKDITGKAFFADCERFAELLNVNLYNGETVIYPKDLEQIQRHYPSPRRKGEKNRDLLMKNIKQNVLYGLELETESDYSMPERMLVYDACEFEQQIAEIEKRHDKNNEKRNYREKKSRLAEGDFLMPVINVVLYLGNNQWEGRRKLSELFQIPEDVKKCSNLKKAEYEFALIEADYVDINNYQTDLREFFQAMQCRKDKKRLNELCRTEKFQHLRADTEWAIAAYIDKEKLTAKIEKEGMKMCQAFDELMADKWEEGKLEGKLEGRNQERIFIIRQLQKEGADEAFISRVTNCTKEELAIAAGM